MRNAAHFKNEDFERLANFKKLRILTAWHNGWDKSQKDKSVYSGAGLVHLKDTEIDSINFNGRSFNGELKPTAFSKAAKRYNDVRRELSLRDPGGEAKWTMARLFGLGR